MGLITEFYKLDVFILLGITFHYIRENFKMSYSNIFND